ncbi:MAG: hypothetical protein V3S40_03970 [Kiloniellales bacterium]
MKFRVSGATVPAGTVVRAISKESVAAPKLDDRASYIEKPTPLAPLYGRLIPARPASAIEDAHTGQKRPLFVYYLSQQNGS